jgi:tRNA threonylcarbamoyl adenosine modification protein YeaZ
LLGAAIDMAIGLKSKADDNSLPIILALDTSSKQAGLAVARGPRLIASLQGEADERRSEQLWNEIDSLLGGAGLTINDVDLFSVCVGPGGFTGLRVGIAAMKGFAAGNNKQIIGVTSLEAVARSAAPARRILATVNAYKGEVYSQLFGADSAGAPAAEGPPVITTAAEALQRVANFDSLVFAGDWVETSIALIKEASGGRFIEGPAGERSDTGWFVSQGHRLLAECIAEIAFERYSQGGGENPEQIRACYVRPSEAEIKLTEGVLGSKIKRVVMRD